CPSIVVDWSAATEVWQGKGCASISTVGVAEHSVEILVFPNREDLPIATRPPRRRFTSREHTNLAHHLLSHGYPPTTSIETHRTIVLVPVHTNLARHASLGARAVDYWPVARNLAFDWHAQSTIVTASVNAISARMHEECT